eukprot:CAMPEP_0194066554 /NCGR_PEP_ID=MMETSP0009_2-20130614/86088_1 /TAXON_ID=210454 /ORGANISM="Grammatophora oceanica, Strain CCMP 410" /LENGTH=410 /DNA_ID=CAMNT_0038719519 /DNA_START=525 /DNA_END=1757 /DNA_ORIENTATION=-
MEIDAIEIESDDEPAIEVVARKPPAKRTIDISNDSEIEIDSDDEPVVENVARMPPAARAIDITNDSDDDSIPSSSRLRHRHVTRDSQGLAFLPSGPENIVNIPSDPTEEMEDSTKWPCPRCTLVNEQNARACAACQYQHQEVRPADATRRERLVGSPSRDATGSSPVLSGALLGTLLFGAGALVTGNSVTSGMFEGAVTGAVSGAMVDSVLSSPSESPVRAQSRRSQRSRGASRRARSSQPAEEQFVPEAPPRQRPRSSVRVVRSNGRTIVTASNRRGSASVRRPGNEDPLMALMMGMASAEASLGRQPARAANVERMSYEELLRQFGDGSENMGASDAMIVSLPSTKIQDVEKELPEEARQCLVCLEEFEKGDTRKTLPCLHGFHDACINKWLQQNGSCPICKHKISVS